MYGLKAEIRFTAKDHTKAYYWSQAVAETAIRSNGQKSFVGWVLDKSSPALKGAFLNQGFLGQVQASTSPRMTDTPSFQIDVPTNVRIMP